MFEVKSVINVLFNNKGIKNLIVQYLQQRCVDKLIEADFYSSVFVPDYNTSKEWGFTS